MTNLAGRPNTAVLVVDVQNQVVAAAHERDAVVRTIGELVARARAEHVPVVWIQHASAEVVAGTEGWKIVPEFDPAPTEPVVHKRYGDSFEATTLEAELADRGVGRVVVCGAQTDACVRATLHGAFTRGYDTVLASDAHTTEDFSSYGLPPAPLVIAHTNMYWTWQDGPGRRATVEPAGEVALGTGPPAAC